MNPTNLSHLVELDRQKRHKQTEIKIKTQLKCV
jgi:hypothetical protein